MAAEAAGCAQQQRWGSRSARGECRHGRTMAQRPQAGRGDRQQQTSTLQPSLCGKHPTLEGEGSVKAAKRMEMAVEGSAVAAAPAVAEATTMAVAAPVVAVGGMMAVAVLLGAMMAVADPSAAAAWMAAVPDTALAGAGTMAPAVAKGEASQRARTRTAAAGSWWVGAAASASWPAGEAPWKVALSRGRAVQASLPGEGRGPAAPAEAAAVAAVGAPCLVLQGAAAPMAGVAP